MNKLTYKQLAAMFREHERRKNGTHLHGAIVFTEDSFNKPYPLESRTYLVSSNNKAFQPDMGGYSIFGTSLDGTDRGIRLEWYMAEEKAGPDGWKVDCCYLIDD